MALQHCLRRGVRLLQIDAPVAQFFQRNFSTGDGAADERAGANDTKIAVEIFDLGLAGQGSRTIGTIEQMRLLWPPPARLAMRPNIIDRSLQRNPLTFDRLGAPPRRGDVV